MSGSDSNAGYRLVTRTAGVAAVVATVCVALLTYDYARRSAKDPLDWPAYKTLLAALDQQPANETLKQQIRDLDLQLRREYFRQRAFTHAAAGLLLVAVVVFLLSARAAGAMKRPMPSPAGPPPAHDRDAVWTRAARRGVLGLCGVLVVAAVAASLSVRSQFCDDVESPRGTGVSPAESSRAGRAPNAGVVETPPTDAEVARAWPRFRGPGGLGISAFANVPDVWDARSAKNVLWKSPVPLPGNNSPVVLGNRVFVSGADQRRREVFCFDADSGKLLWRQPAPSTPQSAAKPPEVMDLTGYAAPTTATDGRRVFAVFANGDLAAFDFAGTLAWSKSLGIPENAYGHAASLAVWKNLLLVQFDQGSSAAGKSKLFAFNTATGEVVWQVARPVPNSWSSPIVVAVGRGEQIVASANPWVIGYNVADGAEVWRARCLTTDDVGPSPTFAAGRVFVANDNSVLSAIRADGRGDVTATHVLWRGKDGMPDTCSPLATDEFVLLLTSAGVLTCYDAAKGGVLWEEDFEEPCSASPGMVGKRVYVIANSGKAWTVEPSREKCRRMTQCDLGEECVTSPAFQEGRVYLRGKKHLFCIGRDER
jgi:outer membrane protein assembly factor BamB